MKNNNATLLYEGKRAMAHWRATRTKRRPIPEQIWDTYSTISQELGLSYQQIQNKLATRTVVPSSQQSAFVSVGLTPALFNDEQQMKGCKIALTKPNGVTLVIDGVSSNFVNEIIANFVGQSC